MNVEAIEKYVNFCSEHHDPNAEIVEKHHVIASGLTKEIWKRNQTPATEKRWKDLKSDKVNLVKLTPANHLRAHWLLVAAFPDSIPVLVAFNLMVDTRGAKLNTAGAYSEEEIEKFAAQYEAAKIKIRPAFRQGGLTAGHKRAKSEWWLAIGRKHGRIAFETGQLARITTAESRSKGGRVTGQKFKENGHMARMATPESRAKGGRIQGRASVASGHLASIRTRENCSAGGRVTSKIPGQMIRMNRAAQHLRWHINRGQFNPKCEVCTEEFIGESV